MGRWSLPQLIFTFPSDNWFFFSGSHHEAYTLNYAFRVRRCSMLRVLFIGLVLITLEKPGSRDGASAGKRRLWYIGSYLPTDTSSTRSYEGDCVAFHCLALYSLFVFLSFFFLFLCLLLPQRSSAPYLPPCLSLHTHDDWSFFHPKSSLVYSTCFSESFTYVF